MCVCVCVCVRACVCACMRACVCGCPSLVGFHASPIQNFCSTDNRHVKHSNDKNHMIIN